jgi:collagenase-like PrtC family protease
MGFGYSVATSWDDQLLEAVAALNCAQADRSRVVEVYGAQRQTIVGGGRPSYRLPEVTAEHMTRHLATAHRLGLRFNYVLNAPHLNGRERETTWVVQVMAFLGQLAEAGVDSLTIASEPLLRLARREFPRLRIHLSLIAGVDTVDEARRFEQLGVDLMILSPFTVNRDLATLRAIRAAVSCELELYANIPCLDHCPMRAPHYLYSARGSRIGEKVHIEADPFLRRCSQIYLSAPVQLLRSPFIRPDDVDPYREIGINVLKLSDRTETTDFLVRTARAYLEERYDGDLFELIFRSGQKFRAGLGDHRQAFARVPLPIRIDNRVLNRMDFIAQVTGLAEPELSDYYDLVTREAVRLPDEATLNLWRTTLQA